MVRIIGLGAGGHAKVVIDALRLAGGCELVGLLDADRELWGTRVLDVPVLGGDDLLERLYAEGIRHAFIGVGAIGDTAPRRRIYEEIRRRGFDMVRVIHPRAVISPSADLGDGPTVLAGAVINAASRIGDNVIVNTGTIIEHDCVVGHHVHMATGARLAGGVMVGDGTHIGVGASVRQGVRIGRDAIVGAGAVVVDDVADGVVVAGVPARPLRTTGKHA